MDQDWFDILWKAGITIFSGGALVKVINHFIQKDKVKAEADKIRAEAEVARAKVYQDLIENVMKQMENVRNQLIVVSNENLGLTKQMAENRIEYMKELDAERISCSKHIIELSDRIKELETINRIQKS